MSLEDYRKKRQFEKTGEPLGVEGESLGNRFVIQEHHATRLHFDLRLEMDGVLKSWAVPKGPSMNPADKRLAMKVEDHPLEYITFRGEIAEGNYGAGEVEIWDSGTYDLVEGTMESVKMVVDLQGTRLHGEFALVKIKRGPNEWLLIKHRDEYADPNWKMEQILPGGSRKERNEIRAKDTESSGEVGVLTAERQQAVESDPMPASIAPMLATLVDEPFSDPRWLFEVKWDGYRALSFISPDNFRFTSRNGENLIDRFSQVETIPGYIDAETAIIDGEIAVVDVNGRPDFQLLQNVAHIFPTGKADDSKGTLVYYVFDLLYLDGVDLRQRPLIERKELLKSIIRAGGFVKYSDHVVENGKAFFEQAKASNLEGIVAKKIDSPYLEKRSSNWLKIKNVRRQELVIGGYTQPRKSREGFGSLVVGTYEGDTLIYGGQVGGGFDDATLRQVYQMLQPLRIEKCPFATVPKTNEPAVWVRPELVCEAKFAEWTDEGILRQPVFQGMRLDKNPRDVVREKPKEVGTVVKSKSLPPNDAPVIAAEELFAREKLEGDVRVDVEDIEVPLSHMDKVYWPEEGYTKGDMLRYYYQVRDTILPYLQDRPLILRRWPGGITEESFYQHNLSDAPQWLKRVPLQEKDDIINYAVANDIASLLYIANLGTIAQNPFFSRINSLDSPDYIALDLDPEHASFDIVCEVAMVMKQVLDDVGLVGYPKTSGSRGMHVYVPIANDYTYEQAQAVGEIIAHIIANRLPQYATVERLKKKRTPEQVYLDYLQISKGKSITCPYSVRERPGGTVSTPLTWDEVAAKPDMKDFTMMTVPERIRKLGDIFQGVLSNKQQLAAPIQRLEKLLAEIKIPETRK